jgi:hypothetical protein
VKKGTENYILKKLEDDEKEFEEEEEEEQEEEVVEELEEEEELANGECYNNFTENYIMNIDNELIL